MEIGSVILTQFAPKIFGIVLIKYFSNIFPKWILKKYPFIKDKLIILLDMPRIYNRNDKNDINFFINIQNFNYNDIVVEKIKLEVVKDGTTVHEFERLFTFSELNNSNYNWKENLTDALINRYSKYFIKYPDSDNFLISKGEFDVRIIVFYSYLNIKGSVDYHIRKVFEMDCGQ